MLLFGIAACSFFSASILLMAKGRIRWKVGGRWKKSPAPKKACWALNRGFWQHLTPSFYFEFVRSDWKGNLICNKNYYILWIILSVFYENQAWLQNITLDPICACDSYFSSFNTYIDIFNLNRIILSIESNSRTLLIFSFPQITSFHLDVFSNYCELGILLSRIFNVCIVYTYLITNIVGREVQVGNY